MHALGRVPLRRALARAHRDGPEEAPLTEFSISSLAPGTRFGPYEITDRLGAGGMGEVYRARDPRLSREVALKVLPATLAADEERLRRFRQEAEAAGLSPQGDRVAFVHHPIRSDDGGGIAVVDRARAVFEALGALTLHDVGEAQALVVGEDLRREIMGKAPGEHPVGPVPGPGAAVRRAAGLLLALLAGPALAQAPVRRGPLESRDEFLLAQPRLTLPATSPDPLAQGETRVRLDGDWGSDFGYSRWRQGGDFDLRFLVDGEHRSLCLEVRHGLTPSLTLGARVPLRWRGPGVLDGLIDAWHDLTGLPDNNRGAFPANRLRVEGRDAEFRPVSWTGGSGTGLGNAELLAHWAPRRAGGGGWTVAAVGRVALPTGAGPFDAAGLDLGAQLVAAHGLGGSWDAYLGAGATLFGDAEVQGIAYARGRFQTFAVLEWRPARRVSLLVEANAASRLVESFAAYPGIHLYLRGGAKLDVAGLRVEGGFIEGLKSVQSTTDFGVMLGVSRSF